MSGINESDLLISGLQHFSFCRRQWALIHIEQQWSDNYLTVDGSLLHDKADDPYFTEKRGGLLISRALPVRSYRYGITGTCDIVEFREDKNGVCIAGRDGTWLPTPVEYKRGKPKEIDADRLQLCAQAICLEEMLCCPNIQTAYLYYMETKRREAVELDETLRNEVTNMLIEMRAMYDRGYTPKVKQSAKCRSCSLADICLPKLQKYRSAEEYTKYIWKDGDGEI
ncbi:MAG: CRISPR-associated protein Cas4 [Eubacteriales bacterium]